MSGQTPDSNTDINIGKPVFSKRQKLKLALMSISLVICGAIIGASSLHLFFYLNRPPRPGPNNMFVNMISKKVDLTEEQKKRITEIADNHFSTMKKTIEPIILDDTKKMFGEIKKIIDPSHHTELDRMYEDFCKRFCEGRPPPMGGPGGPPPHDRHNDKNK